jgi:hypothetical protein
MYLHTVHDQQVHSVLVAAFLFLKKVRCPLPGLAPPLIICPERGLRWHLWHRGDGWGSRFLTSLSSTIFTCLLNELAELKLLPFQLLGVD